MSILINFFAEKWYINDHVCFVIIILKLILNPVPRSAGTIQKGVNARGVSKVTMAALRQD